MSGGAWIAVVAFGVIVVGGLGGFGVVVAVDRIAGYVRRRRLASRHGTMRADLRRALEMKQ